VGGGPVDNDGIAEFPGAIPSFAAVSAVNHGIVEPGSTKPSLTSRTSRNEGLVAAAAAEPASLPSRS
jgi:hypothetical protein